jgi:hypothetical protein
MHSEKFGIYCQLQNKLYLIVIHRFSFVKAAMNALHLCKLRKDCLSDFCHDAMVLTKRLYFLTPIAKGGTKTIAYLPFTEGLSFRSLDRHIYECKFWNDKNFNQVCSEFSSPTSKLVA